MLEREYWKWRWKILNRLAFLLGVLRFFPALRHTVVTPHTNLLIEGYPRSGNTFARNAFLLACDNRFTVTSHLHLIASVRRAIRLNKPVLILIRDPIDAVASYCVYRGRRFPAKQGLVEYVQFYRFVLENKPHLVVATFTEVTEAFGQVIANVNRRFGTRFPTFDHTPENVRCCMDTTHEQQSPWLADRRNWTTVRNVSRPASGRDLLKQAAKNELMDIDCRELLEEAQRLYNMLKDPDV